jgi:hypothetical protein
VPFFKWQVPGAPREKENDPTYKAITDFFYNGHHL